MLGGVPVAFLAGLLSFLAPCVLPLVPGYLSAVSAVDAGRLGERGVARRVVLGSLPFLAGFTVVFVALGAGAGALGGVLTQRSEEQIAGFVVIVFGLAFTGLLPWPEQMLAPDLLAGARRRGSSLLLGAAFGVCAAPCIGPVLGTILVVAGGTSTLEGSVLLLAYSAGLAVPFLVAGIAFARSMTAFRWLRDRYTPIRIASGVTMLALGLLLFFDRFYLLRVYLSRAFEAVGLVG